MSDQKVFEYIQTALARGNSKEDIYLELLSQGTTVAAIQASFDSLAAEDHKDDLQKKTVNIILVVAAVLVGAGIFSFVASNWQEMTKVSKIFVILVSMLTSYFLGWHCKEKLHLSKTGNVLILLGSIIYGAGIFLVGQMFHIRADWPDGLILWMLGSIAVALAIESYPSFYLAILLGIVAIVGYPSSFFEGFTYGSFLLTSSFLLITATVVTFIAAVMVRKQMPADLKKFY